MTVKDGASYRISATPAIIVAQLMGVASLTLMLVWLLKFRGGISVNTDNIQRDFNGHPFFMLLGLIFLGGQAIMAYKTIPGSRRTQKFVHLFLHLMALGLGSLGLYAAFKFHRDTELADMYSLHSWLGMGAFALYGLQLLLAFFTFWFPGATMMARANYLPWHAFCGIVIFLMAIISAETGLVQKFIYPDLLHGSQAFLVNFTGVAIFLFGIATILTVILPRPY